GSTPPSPCFSTPSAGLAPPSGSGNSGVFPSPPPSATPGSGWIALICDGDKRVVAHRKTARPHLFAAFAESRRSRAAQRSVSELRVRAFRRRALRAAPASARHPRLDLAQENQRAAQDSRCLES